MASIDSAPTAKAAALLENVRRTPMVHGRLRDAKAALRCTMARTIEACGVPPRLADRIAFQLVLKFGPAAVDDRRTWRALGELLRRDVERLKNQVGLVERQIVVALPKLSAQQIEDLLEELRAADPTIARTILNSALDAADPVAASRRYLAEFHVVVREVKKIDPGIARTFANATFMAHAPREKAMSHFKRFADLMSKFRDDVEFVRTVARAACRATNPIEAAEVFVAKHDAIVTELTSTGVEPSIARSLAAIASLGAEPSTHGPQAATEIRGCPRASERNASADRPEHRVERMSCDGAPAHSPGVHEQLRHDHESDRRDRSPTRTWRRLSGVSIGQSIALGKALPCRTPSGRIRRTREVSNDVTHSIRLSHEEVVLRCAAISAPALHLASRATRPPARGRSSAGACQPSSGHMTSEGVSESLPHPLFPNDLLSASEREPIEASPRLCALDTDERHRKACNRGLIGKWAAFRGEEVSGGARPRRALHISCQLFDVVGSELPGCEETPQSTAFPLGRRWEHARISVRKLAGSRYPYLRRVPMRGESGRSRSRDRASTVGCSAIRLRASAPPNAVRSRSSRIDLIERSRSDYRTKLREDFGMVLVK